MKPGDKVHYIPRHRHMKALLSDVEFGIVKDIGHGDMRDTHVFVVFNCGHQWDKYWLYTGQLVNKEDLTPGWSGSMQRHFVGNLVTSHFTYTGNGSIFHNEHGHAITYEPMYSDSSIITKMENAYFINGQRMTEREWEDWKMAKIAKDVGLDGLLDSGGEW